MALNWLRWRACAGVERGDAAAVGVAGVAFGDMLLGSTWQAWHSVTSTSTFVSRGRRGSSLCVAGVALGDMYLHFAWQAWHLVTSTSTFVSRGRRGTYGIGLAPVARLGRSGTRGRRGCWRGRRGIWRHAPWFHVAGVALGDIDLYLRFTWQAWHSVTSTSTFVSMAGVVLGDTTSTFAWQAWHMRVGFASRKLPGD